MAIDALAKGLQVLSCFSPANPEWGVTQLSEGLRIHKSRVHRILRTLSAAGYVEQDPGTQKYRLGTRMQSALATDTETRLKAVARPFLLALQQRTKGAIHVRAPRGDANVIIDAIESPLPLRLVRPVGEVNPIYFGASGKALLAFAARQVLEASLPRASAWKRFTERSIASRELFLKELDRVRRAGYAYTDEEAIGGVRSIAAPILDTHGYAIAAITSALPSAALPERAVPAQGRTVARYAALVSEALRQDLRPTTPRSRP